MDLNHNLVIGCPLCEIYLSKNIYTKLHYPILEKVDEVDFVILDCATCKVPMVVIRDHVSEVSKELWGRILYQSKRMFGNVQLRCESRLIKDHYHCHLVRGR